VKYGNVLAKVVTAVPNKAYCPPRLSAAISCCHLLPPPTSTANSRATACRLSQYCTSGFQPVVARPTDLTESQKPTFVTLSIALPDSGAEMNATAVLRAACFGTLQRSKYYTKTLITNKCTKSFIINCNTLLHVSTLLGHLQGELFVIVTLRLHCNASRDHRVITPPKPTQYTVNSTFSLNCEVQT
jgi:hypothetical protein